VSSPSPEQREYAALLIAKATADALAAGDTSYRDIAELVGVSHQGVAQFVRGTAGPCPLGCGEFKQRARHMARNHPAYKPGCVAAGSAFGGQRAGGYRVSRWSEAHRDRVR